MQGSGEASAFAMPSERRHGTELLNSAHNLARQSVCVMWKKEAAPLASARSATAEWPTGLQGR